MCDFKPGDEVVCVHAAEHAVRITSLKIGRVYVVERVFEDVVEGRPDLPKVPGVTLVGVTVPFPYTGFKAEWFRKVQRRDLQGWLSTSVGNTDKLDRRSRRKVSA